MIIGLSGYAQSGKDSVATVLVNNFGFERIAFADLMKDALLALNPYVKDLRLQEVVHMHGWDKAKVLLPEVRRLVQVFGTEVGRGMFGEDFWVEKTIDMMDPDKSYVISDVRFPNEADAIVQDLDGQLVRVVRPGYGPANGHSSETALDSYPHDHIINNSEDLNFLEYQVRSFLSVSHYV